MSIYTFKLYRIQCVMELSDSVTVNVFLKVLLFHKIVEFWTETLESQDFTFVFFFGKVTWHTERKFSLFKANHEHENSFQMCFLKEIKGLPEIKAERETLENLPSITLCDL